MYSLRSPSIQRCERLIWARSSLRASTGLLLRAFGASTQAACSPRAPEALLRLALIILSDTHTAQTGKWRDLGAWWTEAGQLGLGSGGSLELLSEGSEPAPGEISRQLCPRRCPEEGCGLTQKKRVHPGSREGGHAQWALSALRGVRDLPWAWAAEGGGVRWEGRKEQDSCCVWGRSPTPVSFPTTGSLLSK